MWSEIRLMSRTSKDLKPQRTQTLGRESDFVCLAIASRFARRRSLSDWRIRKFKRFCKAHTLNRKGVPNVGNLWKNKEQSTRLNCLILSSTAWMLIFSGLWKSFTFNFSTQSLKSQTLKRLISRFIIKTFMRFLWFSSAFRLFVFCSSPALLIILSFPSLLLFPSLAPDPLLLFALDAVRWSGCALI